MGEKHTKLVSAIIVYCMLSASLFGLITIGVSNQNAAAGGAPGHEDVFVARDWPTSYLILYRHRFAHIEPDRTGRRHGLDQGLHLQSGPDIQSDEQL